jgi:hypothetical protein
MFSHAPNIKSVRGSYVPLMPLNQIGLPARSTQPKQIRGGRRAPPYIYDTQRKQKKSTHFMFVIGPALEMSLFYLDVFKDYYEIPGNMSSN